VVYALVNAKSGAIVDFINGACENHPKKHKKKAIQLKWNVLICTVLKSVSFIFVALLVLNLFITLGSIKLIDRESKYFLHITKYLYVFIFKIRI